MKVKLYSTPACGFCAAAKQLLDERQVPYEETDISDPSERASAQAEHDWPTVPIVLIEGELIGGFTELEAYDRRHGMKHLQ